MEAGKWSLRCDFRRPEIHHFHCAHKRPESDTISLFDATPASPAKLAEIAVGADPASVAIHGNNVRRKPTRPCAVSRRSI